MSNHIHLVVAVANNDTREILKDFKKSTAQEIIRAIRENSSESRKAWNARSFQPEVRKQQLEHAISVWASGPSAESAAQSSVHPTKA